MSSSIKIGAAVVAVVALLALLRFKPWQRDESANRVTATGAVRQALTVGFLPVT
jgi:hypothetical protein